MKKILPIVIGLLCLWQVRAQTSHRFTISGYVREAISGESLIGVNIFLSDRKTGTVTNNFGFFSLTLPANDTVNLIVSYVGFNPKVISINLRKNVELIVNLTSNTVLKEITITSTRNEKQSESANMSIINIPVAQIKNVPSLMGEKDVMKVLQLMPGVQKGSEGSSGIYVRGGAPDQNLIILDDAIVYNASHLFGFFSIFNGDALKSVELTKGGFPARYGGRLSSVLEMNMKEGNKEEWHGEGGIGLLSSRLTVEGPLKKNKSSILISGRRTYIDLFTRPFQSKGDREGYYFYDLNAKINYDFGRNNKLYLSGYFGRDAFWMDNPISSGLQSGTIHWGNTTGTLRWNHLYNNKLFSNTSLIYSNYTFGITAKTNQDFPIKNYYAEFYSGIRDFTIKHDMDFFPNPAHSIKVGFVGIMHRFNPHAFVEADTFNNINTHNVKYINGIESGIYAEDTWSPFDFLKINGGLRFSYFIASKKQYHFLEPRLSISWLLKNHMAIKASYSNMNQFVHMLSNTGMSMPTDLWVPTTEHIKPQQSQQVALGFVKDIVKPEMSLSIEGYYKKMSNVVGYKEGATFMNVVNSDQFSDNNWEFNITQGHALSYGTEILLQKKEGRFNGWIGYTLSWTQLQFDSLNFGRKFYAHYDRRHDISLVGIYKVSPRISISCNWVYGTGNAITIPVSDYYPTRLVISTQTSYYSNYKGPTPYMTLNNNIPIKEYGEKNNFRMSPYHRLDLSIQFHKAKPWGERTWEISVYNVYNHKNPYFYYASGKEDKSTKKYIGIIEQISLFPILPSITYSFKF